MRMHWQNLDERPGDGWKASGHGWRHGRAWLTAIGVDLRLEWVLLRLGWPSIGIGGDMEDGFKAHIALPLLSLCFAISLPFAWFKAWAYVNDNRNADIRMFDGTIWISLWANEMCQRYGKDVSFWHPDKRRITLRVDDWLMGTRTHTSREIEKAAVLVPMPERSYRWTASLHAGEWGRSRWPFKMRLLTVKLDCAEGEQIPVPGKGENSWDCGQDATYSMSCAARTVEDGIGALVASAMRTRAERGGRNWAPEARRTA